GSPDPPLRPAGQADHAWTGLLFANSSGAGRTAVPDVQDPHHDRGQRAGRRLLEPAGRPTRHACRLAAAGNAPGRTTATVERAPWGHEPGRPAPRAAGVRPEPRASGAALPRPAVAPSRTDRTGAGAVAPGHRPGERSPQAGLRPVLRAKPGTVARCTTDHRNRLLSAGPLDSPAAAVAADSPRSCC